MYLIELGDKMPTASKHQSRSWVEVNSTRKTMAVF